MVSSGLCCDKDLVFQPSVAFWCALHRESLSLPPLSPLPHLHPALPPPRWELCNTLRGCQEREDWREDGVCRCSDAVDGRRREEKLECVCEGGRGRLILVHKPLPLSLSSSFIIPLCSYTSSDLLLSSSIKVVDKDGLTTFSGLWLAVAAEQGLKETAQGVLARTAAIFATARHQLGEAWLFENSCLTLTESPRMPFPPPEICIMFKQLVASVFFLICLCLQTESKVRVTSCPPVVIDYLFFTAVYL